MATRTVETYENGTLIASVTEQVPPEQTNAETLRAKALQALQENRDFIASTPDAAAVRNQTKKLSAQVNQLIRLLLNQLDATD